MLKYRSQRVALTVSVLLHLLILFFYRPLAQIRLFPNHSEVERVEAAESLVFELVETPEDALQQRPKASNLLSDKNAIARDEYQDKDKAIGEAYSEGQTAYHIFSGQSEPIGVAQALSRMLQTEQSQDESRDRLQNPNLNWSMKYFDTSQRREQNIESNDDMLLQAARDRLSMQRQFTDDINYDQRKFSTECLGGISLNTYAWEFASYILEMKKKLKDSTYPPAAFTYLGMISGETVLTFRVLPDGTATNITVIAYKGDRSLMETSVDAVKIASPFRPLPRDFPEEYLELRWTFVYFVYH